MLTVTLGEFFTQLLPSIDSEKNKSRFEEVEEEESSKAQKRPRESDATDIPTKSTKKSKKLKAEDGKPVAVETDAVKEDEKAEAKEKSGKNEKKKNKKEKKKADGTSDTSGEKKPTPAKKTIAGGIEIEDASIGTGPMAKKGNTVRMRYVGKLTNGKEFDKNTSGKPVCHWVLV
jgi:FK506-binding nuclear protein